MRWRIVAVRMSMDSVIGIRSSSGLSQLLWPLTFFFVLSSFLPSLGEELVNRRD